MSETGGGCPVGSILPPSLGQGAAFCVVQEIGVVGQIPDDPAFQCRPLTAPCVSLKLAGFKKQQRKNMDGSIPVFRFLQTVKETESVGKLLF